MVYVQMDSTIQVQAVCDYKKRRGTSSGVKCAGAAKISFQVIVVKLKIIILNTK